ncbi:unnamed protein product [Adineta steineri]|nr:unnamed protein product [Adineta steineri]
MPNSIFRLNTIDYDDNQGWIIGMSLCNDDDHSLKEILGHMKKQNGIGEMNLYTFSKMLWKMGKFDQAKMYYIRCVNELSDDDCLLFKAYEDLGRSLRNLPGIGSRNTLRCYVFGFIFLFAITLGIGIYLAKTISVGNGYKDVNQNNHTTGNTRTGLKSMKWKQDGITVCGGNGKGNNLNQFNVPTYIFVDGNYSLYVSDMRNHRVMKWEKDATEGIIVAGGNGQGNSLTQLNHPQGVIVVHPGQIYVADSWNHRVMRWYEGKEDGEIVVGGNRNETKTNQFFPSGLSFDSERNLYVADQENNQIQKFEIIGD